MICYKKNFRQAIVYDDSYHTDALLKLLNNPELAFADSNAVILKDGDSTTVIKIVLDNHALVIKRYNILNFWHGVKRALQMSRAHKSWNSAKRLLACQIHTAPPVACVERRFGPFRGKAYYISEYIQGKDALQYFKNIQEFDNRSKLIANQITAIFAVFKQKQLSHGDMKATNIILQREQPILIDLDAMRLHRFTWTFVRAYKRDIARFMKNWHSNHTVKNYFNQLFTEKKLF